MANNGSSSDPSSAQGDTAPYSLSPSSHRDDRLSFSSPANSTETNPPLHSSFQQDTTIIKSEESTTAPDFSKYRQDDNCTDVKPLSAEALVCQNSHQLVNLLLGDDKSLSLAGVRLDDELFVMSNRDSDATVFPRNHFQCNTDNMPEPNKDMYQWRGDLGLLDRLAYKSVNAIPRSWKMTSMDAAHVERHDQNAQLRAQFPIAGQTNRSVDPQDNGGASDTRSASRQLSRRSTRSVLVQSQGRGGKGRRIDLQGDRYWPYSNLRCLSCRQRRIKCEYTSPVGRCKFCQSHGVDNCIKLSLREFRSSSLNNSSIWTTSRFHDIVGASLKFILSYESDKPSPIGSLVQRIGVPYSFERYPLDNALQWSVLAWGVRQYPARSMAEPLLTSIREAAWCIKGAISTCHIFEREVFASNLLGWVIYSACSVEFDSRVHFKGSIAMLGYLLDPVARKPLSDKIMVFGPFIIDCANAWTIRNGGIPCRSTSFKQRIEYFNELSTGSKAGIWFSGVLEAANSTVGTLLEISISNICQLAREAEFDLARGHANDALQHIRAELGDRDLHKALLTIQSSFHRLNKRQHSIEQQLITRLFHRLRAVLLLHSILDSDSIQTGIASARSTMLGTGLVEACRTHAIRRDDPIDDYYLISLHNYSLMLLGGMTLTPEDSPDLCAWIIDELGFIGKESAARTLEVYWKDRDMVVLTEILDCVRYPIVVQDQSSN